MSNLMSMFKLSRKSQNNLTDWTKEDDKLVQAVEQGRFKEIQRLVQKKKVNPNKLDPQGHSAFHLAAMRNRFEALQLFLAYGAVADSADAQGRTALHCAARHGAAEALDVLLHCKDDAWQSDSNGMTALHHACICGNVDCIISLLRKFPKGINAVDEDGRTSLSHAAHIGHTAVCKELLDRGASPDAGDKHARTCLMYAAENGNAAVCELFLAHRARIDLTDNQGHTALWYAIDGGHSSVKFILERASGVCHEAEPSQAASLSKREVTPIAEEDEVAESENSSADESDKDNDQEEGPERSSISSIERENGARPTDRGQSDAEEAAEGPQPRPIKGHLSVSASSTRLGDSGHPDDTRAATTQATREHLCVGVTDVSEGVSLSDTADDQCEEDDDNSVQVSSLSSDSDSMLTETRTSGQINVESSSRDGSHRKPSSAGKTSAENHIGVASSVTGALSQHDRVALFSSSLSHMHRPLTELGAEQKVELLQNALLLEKKKNTQLSEQILSLREQQLSASSQQVDAGTVKNENRSSSGEDDSSDDASATEEESELLQQQASLHGQSYGRPVAKVEGQQRNVSIKKEIKEIAVLKETVAQLREENAQLKVTLSAREKLHDSQSGQWSEEREQQMRQVSAELRLAALAREELQSELTELRHRAAALTANDTRLVAEVTGLLKRNATLDADRVALQQKLHDSEKDAQRLTKKLATYKSEYRKLREFLRTQEAFRKKLEAENQNLAKQAQKLTKRQKRDAESSLALHIQLQATIDRISSENDGLLDECEEFASAAAHLRDRLDDKNDELARMSELLESNGAILELKTDETRSLEQQVALLVSDVGNNSSISSSRQLAASSKEIQALREQLVRLQHQLSETSERHRIIVEAYRCHLISAVTGRLSKEVEQAVQTIIEMRRLSQ